MARLLIEHRDSSYATRVGGRPAAPADFLWPVCKSCSGPMQFLAQIALHETDIEELRERQQTMLVFQCQNDPGMCDEWDADSGGNAAVLVSANHVTLVAPPGGPTTLETESRVLPTDYDDSARRDTPDDNYCARFDSDASVLGKTGGVALWIQGDETPECSCGERMRFVAQIEARGGGINFGDAGAGYAFACESCNAAAKFLWQCC